MSVIPLSDIDKGGSNVPVSVIDDPKFFLPHMEPGASRYRHTYPDDRHLDALLVNKGSDVLVVSFHGAVVRKTTELPRFERLATFSGKDVNSLYIADPGLWANDKVTLTWFTGWEGINLTDDIANLIQIAREATGSEHVILTGGSGGGFASLQIAPKIPGSLAMVFDPQTTIYGYQGLTDQTRWFFHRSYIRAMMPELAEDNFSAVNFEDDWTAPYGDKMSALVTYSLPVESKVLYTSNTGDSHHERHHLPFIQAATEHGNTDQIRSIVWDGPKGHVPVGPQRMNETFAQAVDWVRQS